MKTCTICQEEKSENQFSFKNKKMGKLHSRCKACQSELHAEHYRKNKTAYIKRTMSNNRIYAERNRNYLNEYKRECGCCACNESEPVVLDFHHTSDNKEQNVSRLANNYCSIAKLEQEMQKCVVICSNCHRKLHAGIISLDE